MTQLNHKPTFYCDVDGVLNLASRTTHQVLKQTVKVKPPALYRKGDLNKTVPFPVRWRENITQNLANLPVSFTWFTTWNHQAVSLLEPLFGIKSERALDYHFGLNQIGNHKGKYSILKQEQKINPRPFIWFDDIATKFYNPKDFDDTVPHLVVRTHKTHGITDEHLTQVQEFIVHIK